MTSYPFSIVVSILYLRQVNVWYSYSITFLSPFPHLWKGWVGVGLYLGCKNPPALIAMEFLLFCGLIIYDRKRMKRIKIYARPCLFPDLCNICASAQHSWTSYFLCHIIFLSFFFRSALHWECIKTPKRFNLVFRSFHSACPYPIIKHLFFVLILLLAL